MELKKKKNANSKSNLLKNFAYAELHIKMSSAHVMDDIRSFSAVFHPKFPMKVLLLLRINKLTGLIEAYFKR